MMLWDTAGQEQFHALTRAYYRGARAAALCFSTIDRDSFEAIRTWKEKVEEECGQIPMVLVQNKVDLLENAVVSRQEAEDLATELGLRFYRICVKENLYVADVFEYLAEMYLQKDMRIYHCQPRPNISEFQISNSSFDMPSISHLFKAVLALVPSVSVFLFVPGTCRDLKIVLL
ncbi:hypothetical protein Mapa_001380 [Marchantia paleacea]|nr:hypothetical protein Mapa_001380 [Marchantia paleacea]